MSSSKSRQLVAIKFAGLATAAALAISGCNANTTNRDAATASLNASKNEAVVVRVIDGDTFVASAGGGEKTVRLLNVDTPETKDPNVPAECMGPEATKALEEFLPVGSKVVLELDKEPLDKYGRTLAGVLDSSGRLVNAEVARKGLGVPVLFEPNRKFYQPVVDAFEEARTAAAGLHSTSIACLPAQQVQEATKLVDSLVAGPLADNNLDLDKGHAGLVTALATVVALKAAAEANNLVHWAAYEPSQRNALVTRLTSANAAGSGRQTAIVAKKKALADVAAEAARQAADAAAAAAAQAAEAERVRNLPPVPAPYVPPAYVPPAYVPPAYVPPAPVPGPKYTGPRCYAPGGKSWTPCSKK
ncbi:thermonuclease family protein [Arthrobacter sp. 2YAF22_2]|uniref:thermonuclease family protein n=1 Tax=Arthrobacter sp. 2YAF22_2 TaxID=3233029 RepID=UPI003F91E5F5